MSINLLPNVTGHTVANWPLQTGDLTDHSGNGNHLSSIDVATHAPSAPVWATIGTGLVGIDLGAVTTNALTVTNHAPFRFTGPFTFEWIGAERFTFTHTYFTCATPPARDGGFGNGVPDVVDSLYTLYWSAFGVAAISDKFYGGGGGLGGCFCNDANAATWSDVDSPWVNNPHPHLFAITRSAAGVVTWYRDGIPFVTTVPSAGTNVSLGTEQFFIGATEYLGGGPRNAAGWFASVRILDTALPQTDLQRDYEYAFLGTPLPATSALSQSVTFAADTGRFYRVAPGHMPRLRGN